MTTTITTERLLLKPGLRLCHKNRQDLFITLRESEADGHLWLCEISDGRGELFLTWARFTKHELTGGNFIEDLTD